MEPQRMRWIRQTALRKGIRLKNVGVFIMPLWFREIRKYSQGGRQETAQNATGTDRQDLVPTSSLPATHCLPDQVRHVGSRFRRFL